MSNKFDKIFRKTDPVKEEELLNYLNSELSPDDTRRVEELLADNEFYADAAEGLELLNRDTRNKLIQSVKQEKEIITKENSTATDWKQFFNVAVAAGIALAIGLFFLFKGDVIEPAPRQFNAPGPVATNETNALQEQREAIPQESTPPFQQKNKQETEADNVYGSAADHNSVEEEEEDDTEDKITVKKEKKSKKGNVVQRKVEVPMSAPAAESNEANAVVANYGTTKAAVSGENTEQGLKKFRKGKYEKAVFLFEKELLANPQDQKATYYCGLAYFELVNYKAAHIKFASIVNAPVNEYTADALWYKAQTLVKLNDTAAAKMCLEQIISGKSKHSKAAQQLLSGLH
jgi:tetratricopeptide (TPR) repeat protein